MGGRLRHGSCTAGCGENERTAVGNLTPNISMELVTASKFSLEGTVFTDWDKTPLDAQLKGATEFVQVLILGGR